MRLLLDFELNVTGQNAGHLVTLTAEIDLVAGLHASVDVDMQDLPLDNSLLTQTALAAVLVADDLSLTVTVGADRLEALDHGSHLAHHGLRPGTTAASTSLDGTLLTTPAFTLRTNHRLLQS